MKEREMIVVNLEGIVEKRKVIEAKKKLKVRREKK